MDEIKRFVGGKSMNIVKVFGKFLGKAFRKVEPPNVGSQLSLFNRPVTLFGGEIKQFGENDIRKFNKEKHRWVDADGTREKNHWEQVKPAEEQPQEVITPVKSFQERWDNAKLDVRVKWVTEARLSKRIAQIKWNDLSDDVREVLKGYIARDYPSLVEEHETSKGDAHDVWNKPKGIRRAEYSKLPSLDYNIVRERTRLLYHNGDRYEVVLVEKPEDIPEKWKYRIRNVDNGFELIIPLMVLKQYYKLADAKKE